MGRLRKNHLFEEKVFNSKNYISIPKTYINNWNKLVFKNNNPIEIEIGTGKGTFIFNKASINPNINFIAIDKYPTILSKLVNKIDRNQPLTNLKIITIDAKEINEVFGENEIDKIYLNFVDPWPKKHHEKFRLTNKRHLESFVRIIKKNGCIEFKTDNIDFFNYSLSICRLNKFSIKYATKNLYNSEYINENIQTEYEKKWINKGYKINKLTIKK